MDEMLWYHKNIFFSAYRRLPPPEESDTGTLYELDSSTPSVLDILNKIHVGIVTTTPSSSTITTSGTTTATKMTTEHQDFEDDVIYTANLTHGVIPTQPETPTHPSTTMLPTITTITSTSIVPTTEKLYISSEKTEASTSQPVNPKPSSDQSEDDNSTKVPLDSYRSSEEIIAMVSESATESTQISSDPVTKSSDSVTVTAQPGTMQTTLTVTDSEKNLKPLQPSREPSEPTEIPMRSQENLSSPEDPLLQNSQQERADEEKPLNAKEDISGPEDDQPLKAKKEHEISEEQTLQPLRPEVEEPLKASEKPSQQEGEWPREKVPLGPQWPEQEPLGPEDLPNSSSQQHGMGVAMGVALGVAGTVTGVGAAALIAVAAGRLKCRGFERKHVYATMEAEPGSSQTPGHFRRPGPPVILVGEGGPARDPPEPTAVAAPGVIAAEHTNESFQHQQETSVEQVTVL